MATVGFIGAGIMGGPMIGNLVAAGHRVRALGRSDRSRERITDAGADLAESVAEVAGADVHVVITMLPDTPDVRALAQEPGGLLDVMTAAQIYVDMSTISPVETRELAKRFAARGVPMLDAPVSGGEAAAQEGTLSVMVGGDRDVLTAVEPVLRAMSGAITHIGATGSGQLTKAANQLVVAANIQALAEAVVLLESAECDVDAALTALAGGLAGSTVLQRKRAAFLTGDFAPGFRAELHEKDLGIVMSTARESHLALPLAAVVAQLMTALANRGGGQDHSALLEVTRSLNRPTG